MTSYHLKTTIFNIGKKKGKYDVMHSNINLSKYPYLVVKITSKPINLINIALKQLYSILGRRKGSMMSCIPMKDFIQDHINILIYLNTIISL